MATHHTPSGLLLELRLTAGRCEIETADTDETVVEAEPMNGSAASRAAAEALEETLSERSQGGHKLVVAMPKLRRLVPLGDAKVLVRIRAPHGAELDAGTASSDVSDGRASAVISAGSSAACGASAAAGVGSSGCASG
jgi:fatty acid/phospholipid biosynthesis enzyme